MPQPRQSHSFSQSRSRIHNGGAKAYIMNPQLSWDGQEFLDSIRNDSVWNKVKSEVMTHLKSAPFYLIFALAKKYAGQKLGLEDE